MSEIRQFDLKMWSDPGWKRIVERSAELAEQAHELADIASFAKRVRLPFSGRIAALYSRLDAWKRECVERAAQAAFERGWV